MQKSERKILRRAIYHKFPFDKNMHFFDFFQTFLPINTLQNAKIREKNLKKINIEILS